MCRRQTRSVTNWKTCGGISLGEGVGCLEDVEIKLQLQILLFSPFGDAGFIRCPLCDAFASASGARHPWLFLAQVKQHDYIDEWMSTSLP